MRFVLVVSAMLGTALGCGDDGRALGPDSGRPLDATTPDAGPPPDAPFVPPPPPPAEPGRHDVEVIDTRAVVPSDGLPDEVVTQVSHNNLDAIRHTDGRVYLAFRAAPTHFASPDVEMYVVSSDDEVTWTFETRLDLDTDLREPRFLALGDSLFLYASRLGTNRLGFEPMGVHVTERLADGTWTPLEELDFGAPGYLAWRTRSERGTSYMTMYLGGEGIYTLDNPIQIELRTTTDGRTWTLFDPTIPVLSIGGGSETDFAIADDGSLYGIIRNEAGDADFGWGSKICRAPAGDLARWTCTPDLRKYDSPLMFWYDGEVYLIARRHLSETGWYDVMDPRGNCARLDTPDEIHTCRTVENQLAYWPVPKRCSLWRWVQGEDRIAYVLDLPSRGDTCFPARIDSASAEELVIYNYSSDIDGPDVGWSTGQGGPTYLYRHVLRFTPR